MSADALCCPTLDASGVRAMPYATGLLHIAMALTLPSAVMAEWNSVRQGDAHLMPPPREETTWPAY